MTKAFDSAFAEARAKFNNWPTIADVPVEKNPLVALADAVQLLDEASAEMDRYISGATNITTLPTWRGGGKSLPVKRFPRYTSDLRAALSLYGLSPGGVPETIPSNPLAITKDAFRRFVAHVQAGGAR